MCSISGFYLNNTKPTLTGLQELAASMQHRGPDGHGHLIADQVGLYHQRLAIHDLSENAKQPFTTPNGISVITNGETYNYLELKQELARLSHDICWTSDSDSEVIPYLYEKYGFNFVECIRGMYALALYDPHTKTLILSRDPFGMKQLYYYSDNSGFYFASELRALVKEPKINLNTMTSICELHFATSSETAFNGIYRVLPGETLSIKNSKIITRTYYSRKKGGLYPQPKRTNQKLALAAFEKVFYESINLHLKADVPIGLFFSGGIDSTCLLNTIKQIQNSPIHTYTIGFTNSTIHDERNLAAHMAKHFNTQHHEIKFSETDFWHYLPKAIAATDDPTADYAIIPTFKLAETAKKDVTVVLSGEGGDEIFAGYGRYRHFIRPLWRHRRYFYSNGSLSRLGLLKTQTH